MAQLDPFDTYPPKLQLHLDQRKQKRVPRGGARILKQFWVASREVPATEKWYYDFGNFIVCGEGRQLRTYLGPDEMRKIEGYALLCWRKNKDNPADLKKCWRNMTLRKKISSIDIFLGSEDWN